MREKFLREDVRERVLGHHAGGNQVDVALLGTEIARAAAVHHLRLDVVEQVELGVLSPGAARQPVVNFREGPAQSADINRGLGNAAHLLQEVELGQQLLRLAHGEDRHQGRAALGKRLLQRDGELLHDLVAGKALGPRLRAAGRLRDEHVDVLAREIGPAQDRLVGEIDIAGIENGAATMADRRAHGAKDVAGIVEIKGERLVVGIGVAVRRPGAIQAARLPDFHQAIELAMGEKRIFGDALFRLLLEHHLHRIVEQRLGQKVSRLAQVNAGAGVFPHQQRQGAGVVVVRVADQDRVDRIEFQLLQHRQAGDPLAARMHARIEHETAVRTEIEQVGIRPDFVAAGQVGEDHRNDIPKMARDGYKQIVPSPKK